MFTNSIKREVRHFHVVVVQWRKSNVVTVQKSMLPAQSVVLLIKGDDTRDDSQRRFLGQHSIATLFRTITALLQHCNAVLSKKSSLRIVPCNITLRLRSHGTRRIFDRLKEFDRTLGSHGTVHYFCSVHTELWTSKRLNVRTVKVGPCERNTLTREFSTGRGFVRCYVNVA